MAENYCNMYDLWVGILFLVELNVYHWVRVVSK